MMHSSDSDHQLERLLALGMIARGLAHDIVNPLNAIVMNAELGLLSLQQSPQQPDLSEVLHTVIGAARQAGGLAKSVTAFARTIEYTPDTTSDLAEIIKQSHSLLGSKLRDHDIKLSLPSAPVAGPGALPVSAQPLALTLAIASLVELTIVAGAKHIELHTAVLQDGSTIELKLTGDGNDIPENRYTELLKSLAQRILTAHRATLTVIPGDADFSVYLPAAEATDTC